MESYLKKKRNNRYKTMEMPLTTIVVPVYNGERSIVNCLSSIMQQRYDNLELIIINDGSQDKSEMTIKKFLKDIPKTKIKCHFINQQNIGVAKTRNKGIQLAQGRYILFVDQDDYIDKNYVRILVESIENANSDMVVSGYFRVTQQGKIKRTVRLKNEEWSKFLNLAPWGKIYRLSFLKENGLHFLNTKKGEDVYLNVLAYAYSDKISVLPYVGYYWVDQEKSVTNKIHTKISRETDITIMFQNILSDMKKCNISQDFLEYFFVKACIYDILFSAPKSGYKDACELTEKLFYWLSERFPLWKKNKNISFFRPKGENLFARFAVKTFCDLYKTGLIRAFLRLYCGWFVRRGLECHMF